MTFSKYRLSVNFKYYTNREILLRSMDPTKDFGIIFNLKLKFADCHI